MDESSVLPKQYLQRYPFCVVFFFVFFWVFYKISRLINLLNFSKTKQNRKKISSFFFLFVFSFHFLLSLSSSSLPSPEKSTIFTFSVVLIKWMLKYLNTFSDSEFPRNFYITELCNQRHQIFAELDWYKVFSFIY